jgi:sugar lactone lactonase YvrE
MRTLTHAARILLVTPAAVGLYLLLWPSPIDPLGSTPAQPMDLSGMFAPNTRLRAVSRLSLGEASGPEDIAFDTQGRIYTGVSDGRVLRLAPDGDDVQTFTTTGGRPLGLRFDAEGTLIVADAYKGLLAIAPSGEIKALAKDLDGVPFNLVNAATIASDGTIYFTDSSRFTYDAYIYDYYEHRPNGRLLAYDPRSRTTRQVLDGLYFANGVALSPDESYLLIDETSASRIRKLSLRGPEQGHTEVLIDNLPGFPDNIASDGRGTFWVGLARGPEVRRLSDAVLPFPFVRRAAALLHVGPTADHYGWVLGVDGAGHVVANLQDPEGQGYSGISTAAERGGVLYLGSIDEHSIGRLSLGTER